MRNKFKDAQWPYIAMSIFLAVIFWVFVRAVVNPDATKTVTNVPIQIIGEDILNANGLTIGEVNEDALDVYIEAPADKMPLINASNITVSVDISRITAEGEYAIPYDIKIPDSISEGSVKARAVSSEHFVVNIGSIYSKIVPVNAQFVGSVSENYIAGNISVKPEFITITGESDSVERIDSATVTIDMDNLSTSIASDFEFELISQDGKVVDKKTVNCNSNTVYVTMPVSMYKEVPLSIALVSGGGATDADATCTIEPSTILISGSANDLAAIREISLGQLNLAEVISKEVKNVPINVDPSITNVTGLMTAEVTVVIDKLATKQISTENISLINVPEGYIGNSLTEALMVTIRGKKEAIDLIAPSQLRVVANMNAINGYEGQYTVPVSVYLDGSSDVGIVGGYTITVQLKSN